MGGLVGANVVIYICLSALQFFALMDGFAYWLGTPGFINFFLALFGGGIPILGTIGGIVGATQVWGWSLSSAILLFFGPLLLVAAITIVIGLTENSR